MRYTLYVKYEKDGKYSSILSSNTIKLLQTEALDLYEAWSWKIFDHEQIEVIQEKKLN